MNTFIFKKTSIKLIFFALGLSLISIIFALSPLYAQSFDFNKDTGIDVSANEAGFAIGSEADSVDSIIGMIIYIALGMVGVLFFGLIILSGIKWMIAQGNEEKIGKAKDSLLNSIIGLAITLGAYAISYFIINYFT